MVLPNNSKQVISYFYAFRQMVDARKKEELQMKHGLLLKAGYILSVTTKVDVWIRILVGLRTIMCHGNRGISRCLPLLQEHRD